MLTELNKRKEIKLLLLIYIFYIVGMFFMSIFTSPLFPAHYGEDSSMLMLLGKGINNGKLLYRDLFDHKGPILFFIEALGDLIGGRIGIWILQCIFGIISITFLYLIWKKVNADNSEAKIKHFVLILIVTYAVFFFTFDRGNLTEEYSIPFILGCFYLFFNYISKIKSCDKHPYSYAFVYGICISVITFIRINNAVTICAGVLIIGIYLIAKKEYKNFIFNVFFGILGFATVALPVILYFYFNGTLYEMIEAAFIHNFKYATNVTGQSFFEKPFVMLVRYLPMIISAIFLIPKLLNKKRKKELADLMLAFIVIMNFIAFSFANVFFHYFAIFVPVYAVVLMRYWKFKKKSLETILIILCTTVYLSYCGLLFGAAAYNNFIGKSRVNAYNSVKAELQNIPEDEKYSVIGYEIPVYYYLYGDILPSYKYYTLQEWWDKINPDVYEEFIDYVYEEKPLWLLTTPDEDDEGVLKVAESQYELKHKNDYIWLYRLK